MWVAESPYDLIGWEITSIEQEGREFVLQVEKKDTRESRTVHASIEAVPLQIMDRYKRH